MIKLLKNNFGVLFVIFFAILACLPLFHDGFYPMHDNEQIARLFDLNQALQLGQFPPRLSPNLGFGYGYPFFNFYPSFAYYVGEIFVVLGFGYILSTKLMLFVGFALAAYFAYLLAKELFGEWGGIVAAAFYTFAPYHAVDIYVRGAYAEFFSFVFLPAVFWAIYKISKSMSLWYVIFLSLSTAFLILSHNLIFIMTLPFIGLWWTYSLYASNNRKIFLINSLGGFILGFGLSAYFSLPSYIERDYTLVRILTSELASYDLHFVCVHQLWNSAWGYGGSIPSCADGLSFEVGKIQLIASFTSVILLGYTLLKKRKNPNIYIVPVFTMSLLIAMFLSVRQSKFIWDALTPLWYIQFPWRFLTLCVLFSSLLAGSIISYFKNDKAKVIISFILVLLVIVFNISDFTPQGYLNVTDKDYIGVEKIRWDTSSLAYEYVPEKIATKKSKDNTTQVDITREQIKKNPYKIIKGVMVVKVKQDLPQEKVFELYSLSGGVLRINSYGFPGWQIYIDGKKTSYSTKNKLVLMDVVVPSGNHTVKAVFENTPVRMFGNSISILSIIVVCVIGFIAIKKKHE